MPEITYDSLTGALPQSALGSHIQQALEQAQAGATSFSLVMLDLDYFKSINDAFGHLRGDQALVEVVRRIRSVVRSMDTVFRYGGDEFIVILPESAKQQAIRVAERIRHALSDTPLDGSPPISLTASVGLVTFPEDAQTPEELFEASDRRLYRAKAQERGSLVFEDESEAEEGGSPFRSPDRLIERENALKQARSFLQQLPGAHFGILTINAPAGSGRTRFIAEVAKVARLQGYAIWSVAGSPALQVRHNGALIQMQQASGWQKPQVSPASLAAALKAWVADKKFSGLLVCVDGIEGIDFATLETMQLLTGMGLPFPLGLVYSGSPSPEAHSLSLEAFLRQEITLEPLSERGLQIWIRHSLHWEVPAETAAWLHAQTGGLPAKVFYGLNWLIVQGLLRPEHDGWSISGMKAGLDLSAQVAKWSQHPANLPHAFSHFLGREDELWKLKNLLRTHSLVTISGPDGIGKSRLALQAAAENLDQFPDGVFWISIGDGNGQASLPEKLAETLNLSSVAADHLVDHLHQKSLLLVLDDLNLNYGKTTETDTLLSRLLQAAPQVHLLVTSVYPLGFPEEIDLPLQGFTVPAQGDPGELLNLPVVQFFLHIARQERSDIIPGEDDLAWILRICSLVEGMPLGVEMAAVWVSSFTCRQIAEELEHNVNFLAQKPAGDPTLPQRRLAAVFDAFWNILSPLEQEQVQALSVFRGGFSQAAAGSIAHTSPFFLDALVDKKILRIIVRQYYTMHNLLAQYAAAQLHAKPELEKTVSARHSEYYLRFLAQSGKILEDGQETIKSLAVNLPNFHRAWEQAIQAGSFNLLAQSAENLFKILAKLGRFTEGIDLARSALTAIQQVESWNGAARLSIQLMARQGEFYYHIGQYTEGILVLKSALALLESQDEPAQKADILRLLANMHIINGEYDQALTLLKQSLAIAASLKEPQLLFALQNRLGVAAYFKKDYSLAAGYFKAALEAAQETGDAGSMAVCLSNLGNVAIETHDYDLARTLLLQSLDLCSPNEMTTLQSSIINSLGGLELACSQLPQAAGYFARALRLLQDIDAIPLSLEVLVNAAQLWHLEGRESLAFSIASVVSRHPAAQHDIRQRASALSASLEPIRQDELPIQWQPGHLRRVIVDVIEMLGQPLTSAISIPNEDRPGINRNQH